MSESLKPGLILFLLTVAAVFLLSAVYFITREPIQNQRERQKNAEMARLLPDAKTFEKIETVSGEASVGEVYAAYNKNGDKYGYLVFSEASGFGGEIEILTAVEPDGVILSVCVIKSSETPGLGEKIKETAFTGQFNEKSSALTVTSRSPGENEIHAVTGATISSRAMVSAVNAAIDYYNNHIKE